jgi:hypothetical protein
MELIVRIPLEPEEYNVNTAAQGHVDCINLRAKGEDGKGRDYHRYTNTHTKKKKKKKKRLKKFK